MAATKTRKRPTAMQALRAVVLARDGQKCWRDGKWHPAHRLHLHHNSRRNAAAKYNETTCVMLCMECHEWEKTHPTAWEAEVLDRDPDFHEHCRQVEALVVYNAKPDPDVERERLLSLLEGMQ